MQTYKLDPYWYFTTPALSWDAMLLHTKVAIELFTDYDMPLFYRKGYESDVGYILKVDLEYPSDLPDKHSDFPFAPENKPPPNCKEPRLLTSLEPKTKYVLHYSNLKLYLKLGCRRKQFNSLPQLENQNRCRRKITQLVSRNETTRLNMRKTTQLSRRNETTQLSRRN
ncbi:uncharacterized protein TNCV_4866781 [Trichonephila clavipes]|nr:uncharacterized protein TNCV_4866781 [Trichonephila clavipes]